MFLTEEQFYFLALLWKRSGSGKRYPETAGLAKEIKTTSKAVDARVVELYKKGLVAPLLGSDDLNRLSITCLGAEQMEAKSNLSRLCNGCEICKRAVLPGIHVNQERTGRSKGKRSSRPTRRQTAGSRGPASST